MRGITECDFVYWTLTSSFQVVKARHRQHAEPGGKRFPPPRRSQLRSGNPRNFLNNWTWAFRFYENSGFEISEIWVKFWNADVDFPQISKSPKSQNLFPKFGKIHVSISKFNANFRNIKSKILTKSERSTPIIKEVTSSRMLCMSGFKCKPREINKLWKLGFPIVCTPKRLW